MNMAELLVVGFKEAYRAVEVLGELEAMDAARWIHLDDAVAVSRSGDGTLSIDKSVRPRTKDGAVRGGILGGLLGALVLAPFTGGTSAALAAAAMGGGAATMGMMGALAGGTQAQRWKEAAGITDDFVKRIGGLLQEGQSAIFALATLSDPPAVVEHFRGTGGNVLHSTLPPDATANIDKTLTPQVG
jgi:uncharacterized membrane protein